MEILQCVRKAFARRRGCPGVFKEIRPRFQTGGRLALFPLRAEL
jgi:hypothetical protein